jgi:tetratricopeptide (TPR) repeat protein
MAPTPCPVPETLEALAAGGLAPVERATVEAHLDGCSGCRQVVSALARWTEPSNDPAPVLAPAPVNDPEGATLGRYRIISRLGAGAMGIVYRAHDPELDRAVALKVLGHDQDEASATRLLREARSMARLAHPRVIRVYDAGICEGQVFLAMELVEGLNLAQWLLRQPRSLAEILSVFSAAGQGLAAAHAAGLVHRDFKPANVLVGDDGAVLVADFGLARKLDGDRSDTAEARDAGGTPSGCSGSSNLARASALTRTGARVGTPAYMAPEQEQGRADARSDQYSFCVSLHDALIGVPERSPRAALLRVIQRGMDPDPARRFASMEALLLALSRFQPTALPAAEDTAPALTLVAVVTALAVLLLWPVGPGPAASDPAAATASASVATGPCHGPVHRLDGVWDPARRHGVARALARGSGAAPAGTGAAQRDRALLRRLDDYAARWTRQRREACQAGESGAQSAEALDLRMGCLDARREELAALVDLLSRGDPTLLSRAATAAGSLSELADCADLAALRSAVPLPAGEAARKERRALQLELGRSLALQRSGRFKDGLALTESLVARADVLAYAPLQAEAYLLLGKYRQYLEDLPGAERALHRAVEASDQSRDDRRRTLACLELSWVIGYRLGRSEEGLRYLGYARAATARLPLARQGDLPARLSMYQGTLLQARGDPAGAARAYGEALEAYRRLDAVSDVPVALNNLGEVLLKLGRAGEAAGHFREALELWERSGEGGPRISWALDNLGEALASQGRLAEAQVLHQRALTINRQGFGPSHPAVSRSLRGIGEVLLAGGRALEALERYREALRSDEQTLGAEHFELSPDLMGVAGSLVALGRAGEAVPLLERALQLQKRRRPVDPAELSSVTAALLRAREAARGSPARRPATDGQGRSASPGH